MTDYAILFRQSAEPRERCLIDDALVCAIQETFPDFRAVGNGYRFTSDASEPDVGNIFRHIMYDRGTGDYVWLSPSQLFPANPERYYSSFTEEQLASFETMR